MRQSYNNRFLHGFAFALLSGLLAAGLLPVQEAHGSILDRVADPSAGTLPSTTVDVTSKALGTRPSLVTNDQGFCQAMFLPPGLYLIEVNVDVYLSLILPLLNGDSASEVLHDNDSPFSTVDFRIYGFSNLRPHE